MTAIGLLLFLTGLALYLAYVSYKDEPESETA